MNTITEEDVGKLRLFDTLKNIGATDIYVGWSWIRFELNGERIEIEASCSQDLSQIECRVYDKP
jgi:hypothetical protein